MDELIEKAYKKSRFYYYTIFAKALFFALIGYMFNMQYPGLLYFSDNTITIISSFAYVYLLSSIPFALWWYSKKIAVVATIENTDERYAKYMYWVLFRQIVIGASFVGNIILLYLLHSNSFLYAAAIGAVGMIFCKPNKNSIERELNPIVEIED